MSRAYEIAGIVLFALAVCWTLALAWFGLAWACHRIEERRIRQSLDADVARIVSIVDPCAVATAIDAAVATFRAELDQLPTYEGERK